MDKILRNSLIAVSRYILCVCLYDLKERGDGNDYVAVIAKSD
jgi:hypothetical protein